MIQYLLGNLSELEVERLDQLSIADDGFARALKNAETDLVDAYAAGDLEEPDRQRFRDYYLSSPRRRARAEFAVVLQKLEELAPATAQQGTITNAKPIVNDSPGWLTRIKALFSPSPVMQWAGIAIAVGAIALCAVLFVQNSMLKRQVAAWSSSPSQTSQPNSAELQELERLRAENQQQSDELAQARAQNQVALNGSGSSEIAPREPESRQPKEAVGTTPANATVATLMLLPQLRGTSNAPVLKLKPTDSFVSAGLGLDPVDYPSFRVGLLQKTSGRELWYGNGMHVKGGSPGGTLRVRFSTRGLKPGEYTLRVTGITATGDPELVGEYPFTVAHE